jgi:hypothetical protein
MPEERTIKRAKKAKREGKSPSTQAGEFVREEMHHVREGKHGARSTKQMIAIGLSKARRAGVDLRPPKKGTVSEKTRRSATRAYESGRSGKPKASRRRSAATERALKREGRSAASKKALSQQARSAARKRTRGARSAAARQGARTKVTGDVPPRRGRRHGLAPGAPRSSAEPGYAFLVGVAVPRSIGAT